MQEALKCIPHGTLKEIIKILKTVFLTHRQHGLSEGVYKSIPSLRLKNSNITCIYCASGFPENRSVFYRKTKSNELEEAEEPFEPIEEGNDEDDEENPSFGAKTCKIEGREGLYEQATTHHDRYAVRPKLLENMCLAQFVTHYTHTPKVPKQANFDEDGNCENMKAATETKVFNSETVLPKYISLENAGLGFLRLRAYPAVMRIHSSKRKEGHERQYSEMLLFSHWRDEVEDLHRHSPELCIKEFEDRKAEVDLNRKMVYPGEPTLDEMSTNLFDNEALQERPSHIYDTLNPQGEQDQYDDRLEGDAVDPEYESFGYLGNLNLNNNDEGRSEDFKYRKITLPDKEEMNFLIRRLAPEQRIILKEVAQFCKDILKASSLKARGTFKVTPIRLIIHGGSGSGKSSTIRAISLHAEEVLRKQGDHPHHPKVLLAAPTGKAASNISKFERIYPTA